MRSISKAMIAVMIAAAMCVVPLFVIEDADAAEIKTGDKALSAEASDVSVADFNKLMNNTAKTYMILMPFGFGMNASEVTFSEIQLKIAVTEKAEDKKGEMAQGEYIKTKISYEKDLSVNTTLFERKGGLEELYDYMGTNIVNSGKLKVEGTVEVATSTTMSSEYYKTDEGKIATDSSKMVMNENYKGNLTVTYNNGTTTKTFDVEITGAQETTHIQSVYYMIDDKAKVIAATPVLVNSVNVNSSEEKATYNFDGKTASYEEKSVPEKVGTFIKTTAGDASLLSNMDVEVETIYYYSAVDGDVALFEDPDLFGDASLANNSNMETFLKTIGSVSDSYSTASSIVDDATAEISSGGSSGNGGNNIIFYVIIGVLAVAVVALAVLLIKKK